MIVFSSVLIAGVAFLLLGLFLPRLKELTRGFSVIFGVVLIIAASFVGSSVNSQSFKPEYELEILNQDSVAVKSLSTGRIYKVHFDKVHEALLKDNL